MPDVNFVSVPDLEACVGKVVTVHQSTQAGVEVTEGLLGLLQVPWQLDLAFGHYEEGVFEGTIGEFCTFAGADGGITKIEVDGREVYINTKVPVPYPHFDMSTDEGLAAMNALRRTCFGEGFDYMRGPQA